jgi:hypothetical protein
MQTNPPPWLTQPNAQPVRPKIEQDPRIRLEIGIEGGFFGDTDNAMNQTGGFGPYLRLGAQIRDWIAFQFEGSFGYLIDFGYIRGAVTLNITPRRFITLSAGPAVGYLGNALSAWYNTGITLRSDFHVLQYRTTSGYRHSFTLGLAGDLGKTWAGSPNYDLSGPQMLTGITIGGMLNIGYTLH